jgi:integrase
MPFPAVAAIFGQCAGDPGARSHQTSQWKRRGDPLRLRMSDLQDDGIHFTPGKTEHSTGKRLIIEWSEELREAVALAKSARPVKLAP